MNTDKVIRTIATSDAIAFGTDAPFNMGQVKWGEIGFASIPVVGLTVMARSKDSGAIVPVARAKVFGALRELGFTGDDLAGIQITPSILVGRRRKTQDLNSDSPSHRKMKMLDELRVTFEVTDLILFRRIQSAGIPKGLY